MRTQPVQDFEIGRIISVRLSKNDVIVLAFVKVKNTHVKVVLESLLFVPLSFEQLTEFLKNSRIGRHHSQQLQIPFRCLVYISDDVV